MSFAPVRVDWNASRVPSGEYSGRDSSAGSEINRCASPPFADTVQISPPDANAISLPSGESAGLAKDGFDGWASVESEREQSRAATRETRTDTSEEYGILCRRV